MTRFVWLLTWISLFQLAAAVPVSAEDKGNFDGEWHTSAGMVTLKQTGDSVIGNYGKDGKFRLSGMVAGNVLKVRFQEGEVYGAGEWTLSDTKHSFRGTHRIYDGRLSQWNGWRPDPEAATAAPVAVDGLWLTNMGLMELKQDGDRLTGRYALRGVSVIDDITVTGRRLDFTSKSMSPGKGWWNLSADGKTLVGAATADGTMIWWGWEGRRAPEFARHAPLAPGKIVDGSTKGLLTYSIRAPEDYQPDDRKKWPTIVILHGPNMSGKAYVNTIAVTWPTIAKNYILLGINGEVPSNIELEPAFNYRYVSYMGRSTYKGFPGTDRESPALVAEALDELREVYPVEKYFVGGHSQGGFLTYSLLMNFPDRIAGAFPISAGVLIQCDPAVFNDQQLRAAQRAVPLAIIQWASDRVVPFSSSELAEEMFGDASWPAFRFFPDSSAAGHMFARLPIDEAIRWLEVHTSNDPLRLLEFAEQRMKADGYRDAIAVLNRIRGLTVNVPAIAMRFDRLSAEIDAKARPGAQEFLPKVMNAKAGDTWIEEFLTYREQFEFAVAAREVMRAFEVLRTEHDAHAKKALNDAKTAFQDGKRKEGVAKYQEIVDRFYASPSYRNAKRFLAKKN